MDEYTSATKTGLEDRFKLVDADGIYYAFQPIYGFNKGHSELGLLARYTRTYAILSALAKLKMTSLLDVGGAEGYSAHLIRTLFGTPVEHCELSEEACKRAREIFGLKSTQADVQALPFRDGQFDVVLCSETMEHVPDREASLRELLRVARRAVVITVPHEPEEVIAHIRSEGKFHGHIHTFDSRSFDHLKAEGYQVSSKRIVGILSRVVTAFTEPYEREWRVGMSRVKAPLIHGYNAFMPVLKAFARLSGRGLISLVMKLDALSCGVLGSHGAIVFVIVRDAAIQSAAPQRRVRPGDILDITVPYIYLRKEQ